MHAFYDKPWTGWGLAITVVLTVCGLAGVSHAQDKPEGDEAQSDEAKDVESPSEEAQLEELKNDLNQDDTEGKSPPTFVPPPPLEEPIVKKEEDDGTGPKIMGYGFTARLSYGLIKGRYSDKQKNEANSISDDASVPVKGRRFVVEQYPVIYEGETSKQHLYTLFEYRDERPEADYWQKRQTMLLLAGFVLPRFRLIAPVVGISMEFNRISLDEEDSPEIAKSDIRATVLGVDLRRKIWGAGSWLGLYYEGRLHLLNYTLPNNGKELELGLGTTLQWSSLRLDATISYLYQTYTAKRESESSRDKIKIDSLYRASIMTVTLWI